MSNELSAQDLLPFEIGLTLLGKSDSGERSRVHVPSVIKTSRSHKKRHFGLYRFVQQIDLRRVPKYGEQEIASDENIR
jgi:hypothetical protein